MVKFLAFKPPIVFFLGMYGFISLAFNQLAQSTLDYIGINIYFYASLLSLFITAFLIVKKPSLYTFIPQLNDKLSIIGLVWIVLLCIFIPPPKTLSVNTLSFTTQTTERTNEDFYSAETLIEQSLAARKSGEAIPNPKAILRFQGLKNASGQTILSASEFKYPDSWQLWLYGNQALGYMNGSKSRVESKAFTASRQMYFFELWATKEQKVVVNFNGDQTLHIIKLGKNLIPISQNEGLNQLSGIEYIITFMHYLMYIGVFLGAAFILLNIKQMHINFVGLDKKNAFLLLILLIFFIYLPTLQNTVVGTAEFTNLILVRKPYFEWSWYSARPMSIFLFRNLFAHIDSIYQLYIVKTFTLFGVILSVSALWAIYSRIIKQRWFLIALLIILVTTPVWNTIVVIYASLVYGVFIAILALLFSILSFENSGARKYIYLILSFLAIIFSATFSQIIPQAVLIGTVPFLYYLHDDLDEYNERLKIVIAGIVLCVVGLIAVYLFGTLFNKGGAFQTRGQINFAIWKNFDWFFNRPFIALHSLWGFGDEGKIIERFYAFLVFSATLFGLMRWRLPDKGSIIRISLYGVLLALSLSHILLIGSNLYQLRMVLPAGSIVTIIFTFSLYDLLSDEVKQPSLSKIVVGLIAVIMTYSSQSRIAFEFDAVKRTEFVAMRQAVHMIGEDTPSKIYVIIPDPIRSGVEARQSRFGMSTLGHYGVTAFNVRWQLHRYFDHALSTLPPEQRRLIKQKELIFGYRWQEIPEEAFVIDLGWLTEEPLY